MTDEPVVPLLGIRGVGPSAKAKIEASGITTANALASISVAEFKLRCPELNRKATSFIKSARTAVRRARNEAGLSSPAQPQQVTEQTTVTVSTKTKTESQTILASAPQAATVVAEKAKDGDKKSKKVKKQKPEKTKEKTAKKDKKAAKEKKAATEKKGKSGKKSKKG